MKVTRFATTLCLVLAPTIAIAMPAFLKTASSTYQLKGAAAKASCGLCHVGMNTTQFNPYGKDLKAAMAAAKSKVVTPAILKSIESKDSDKDGVKNGAELKKGTLPGDPKSK